MTNDLRFEHLIAGTPERVFNAFTDPDGQREFYGRDEPGWIVESRCDLRVGGVWSVAFGPSSDELYHHRRTFEVIERPRRIRMALTETRADGLSLDLTMELTFEPRGDRTLMTMTQTGFPERDAARRAHDQLAQRLRPHRAPPAGGAAAREPGHGVGS